MEKVVLQKVVHPEALSEDVLKFLKKNTEKKSNDRWWAAVSMAAGGVGYDLPAECLGDITFLWNGQVVRFNGQGKQTTGGSPGGGVGAFPFVRVLNPDKLLKAKKVTWKVYGAGYTGLVVIVADDFPVFEIPFPIAGGDIGFYQGEGRLFTPEKADV